MEHKGTIKLFEDFFQRKTVKLDTIVINICPFFLSNSNLLCLNDFKKKINSWLFFFCSFDNKKFFWSMTNCMLILKESGKKCMIYLLTQTGLRYHYYMQKMPGIFIFIFYLKSFKHTKFQLKRMTNVSNLTAFH